MPLVFHVFIAVAILVYLVAVMVVALLFILWSLMVVCLTHSVKV